MSRSPRTPLFNFTLVAVDMGNYTFLVTLSEFEAQVEAGEVILFDQVRINVGDNYDPTTGVYTGMLNLLYEFCRVLVSNIY